MRASCSARACIPTASHDFGALLRYSFNRTIDAHYHPRRSRASRRSSGSTGSIRGPHVTARSRTLYAKLIEHCLAEHEALAAEAGATDLFRRTGWMKIFRTERERDCASRKPSAGGASSASTRSS